MPGESYKDVWKELPDDWLQGLSIKRQVASSIYDETVNKYGKKCGGSLEMWEGSDWIVKQDPYGWFQWYCRSVPAGSTAGSTADLRGSVTWPVTAGW